jgi:squalene-associated FAD-dependent desaturase
MTRRMHIVGGGLAGLSAAVCLAGAGHRVSIYEAGPQAGGRCRSYFDEVLGCSIDNGNHLLLSGNRRAFAYLETIGAEQSVTGPAGAIYPFIDLRTNERWTLAPSRSRLPLWLLDRNRRVPGTGVGDYLSGMWRLARASREVTVAQAVAGRQVLYERLWQPLAVSILNTEAAAASAQLFWAVMNETMMRGADGCMPRIARVGLSESFIQPALDWLRLRGGALHLSTRVRSIGFAASEANWLETTSGRFPIEPGDGVIIAVPAQIAVDLVPELVAPTEFRPILNAHFVTPGTGAKEVELIGIVGGTAEWIFRRGPLVSITVSAATALMDEPAEALAARLWHEIKVAFGLDGPVPPYRIVKERRATFAQTPAQLKRRPATATRWRNLALAGDWTATGLPATIEGAIVSGESAAKSILQATQ